jgi:hypothetical protein
MNLEEIIRHDPKIATIKEKPYASIFILAASAICAHLSTSIPQNENFGFSMMLFSSAIAIWGLKGIIWPRKHFILKESGEQLTPKFSVGNMWHVDNQNPTIYIKLDK